MLISGLKVNLYIDANNLHRSARSLGFEIDYKKFRGWLRQKYAIQNTYLFLGYIPARREFYTYLRECGFILVFKPTVPIGQFYKGNCDTDLVLKVVTDLFTEAFDSCYVLTGDGDFGSLIQFLSARSMISGLIAPDEEKCSYLLKNKNVSTTFLSNHYHKFSDAVLPS